MRRYVTWNEDQNDGLSKRAEPCGTRQWLSPMLAWASTLSCCPNPTYGPVASAKAFFEVRGPSLNSVI